MYKQIIVALLISFSFSYSAIAQVSIYGSAGVNSTGINLSNDASANIYFENQQYIQPFLTLGVAAPINNKLYWLGELSYSPSGYEMNHNSITTNVRYNLINFQTGLGYQLGPLRIEGGGFFGLTLSDQFKGRDGEWSNKLGLAEDFNLGAFTGLNLSLTKNIGIFARYYRGLTPISKISITDFEGIPNTTLNEKINNLQFGISIRLF